MTPRLSGGSIRRLWPGEEALLADHLKRLDPAGRASRFGAVVSDAAIDAHVERVRRTGATVFAYVVDGQVRGVGELHRVGGHAEGAFTVELELRGQGIGSRLFRRVLRAAAAWGVDRLVVDCFAGNRAMRRIAVKNGATIESGAMDVVALFQPRAAMPFTLLREALSAGGDATLAALDAQARILSAA